nr:unnamed protein product [Callosobruchus analis]
MMKWMVVNLWITVVSHLRIIINAFLIRSI